MPVVLRPLQIVLASAGLALSACGQKGPLYLPDEAPSEAREVPPPATPAPETSTDPAPAQDKVPEEAKDTDSKPDEKPR